MSSQRPHTLSSRSTTAASFKSDLIDLVDNTQPSEQSREDQQQNKTATEDDTTQLSPVKSSSLSLNRKVTGTSIRESLARRKYAKYTEERYAQESITERPGPGQRTHTLDAKVPAVGKGKERVEADEIEEYEEPVSPPLTPSSPGPTSSLKKSRTMESKLRSGQQRVKRFMHWHRHKYKLNEGDIAVDILYENQRGTFIFGNPLFSSQSLLNFDPPGWTNAYGGASPVDITNAQVPDPTWTWDWPLWYVDMGEDVDDQGWQYSFSFAKRFSWHGTHPWFHSFVRRRRWIRRRVRKHHHLPDGRVVDASTRMTVRSAHKMNEDYFTIHPPSRKGAVTPDSRSHRSGGVSRPLTPTLDDVADRPIDNIQDLVRRVKHSKVDREKISLVLQFMSEGSEDACYLADELPYILTLFVFQHSRRQLLTGMLKRLEEIEHAEDSAEPTDNARSKASIASLRKAVEAADAQVRQLEYWSDIKDVVRRGETLGGVDGEHGWEPDEWIGLDAGGPPHPDHEDAPAMEGGGDGKE